MGIPFTGGTPDSMGNEKMPISLGFYKCKRSERGSHPLGWGLPWEPLRMGSLEHWVVEAARKQHRKQAWSRVDSHWTTISWTPSVQDNASGMTLSHTHRTQARSLKSWSLFRACQDNEGDCHYNSILQMRKLRPRGSVITDTSHTQSRTSDKLSQTRAGTHQATNQGLEYWAPPRSERKAQPRTEERSQMQSDRPG